MTIDAVVAGIKLALDKPRIVAIKERSAVNGVEIATPAQEFTRGAAPELVGLGNGFFVKLLVLFEIYAIAEKKKSNVRISVAPVEWVLISESLYLLARWGLLGCSEV
jgi:hypothetical protein